jgi:hypothetical protein
MRIATRAGAERYLVGRVIAEVRVEDREPSIVFADGSRLELRIRETEGAHEIELHRLPAPAGSPVSSRR